MEGWRDGNDTGRLGTKVGLGRDLHLVDAQARLYSAKDGASLVFQKGTRAIDTLMQKLCL
jgi:hypothetical protein